MNEDIYLDRIDETTVKLVFGKSLKNRKIIYDTGGFPGYPHRSEDTITTDEQEVLIKNLNPKERVFFTIQIAESAWIELAEKRIVMEGSVNFRDLGGYRNCDRQMIKWGTLFRADSLHRLSEIDLEIMASLKINTVIDFRTDREAKQSPDALPPDQQVNYVHLPIKSGEFDFISAMKLLADRDSQWPTGDFMVKNYESYLTDFPKVWKRVFLLLADTCNYPLVFHCTAGKDRTGVCAALIMLLLKIPEEEIIQDHQLSNEYIASIVDSIKKSLEDQGYPYEKLEPFFSAPLNAINRFLDILKEEYGTVDSFLIKKVELDPGILQKVRENLLRPAIVFES